MILQTAELTNSYGTIFNSQQSDQRGKEILKNSLVLYLGQKITLTFGMILDSEPFYLCLVKDQLIWIHEDYFKTIPEELINLRGFACDDWP